MKEMEKEESKESEDSFQDDFNTDEIDEVALDQQILIKP